MTLNMQFAVLFLAAILIFLGTAAYTYDQIGRHNLHLAGERATETIYIRYTGHYLPYEETV